MATSLWWLTCGTLQLSDLACSFPRGLAFTSLLYHTAAACLRTFFLLIGRLDNSSLLLYWLLRKLN